MKEASLTERKATKRDKERARMVASWIKRVRNKDIGSRRETSKNFEDTYHSWAVTMSFEGGKDSSVASPICQEGQSEKTFPIFAFSSRFFLFFPDVFLRSRFLANFSLSGVALCPLDPQCNYSLCVKPNLRITQKVSASENSHPLCEILFQNLPQVVYGLTQFHCRKDNLHNYTITFKKYM